MKTLLWLKAPAGPVRPPEEVPQRLGPGDHGDDHVRGPGQGLGVGGQAGPLFHQKPGLLRVAVVDHDGVAGLQEIGGHGTPHDPQAHKPDFWFHRQGLLKRQTEAAGRVFDFRGASPGDDHGSPAAQARVRRLRHRNATSRTSKSSLG